MQNKIENIWVTNSINFPLLWQKAWDNLKSCLFCFMIIKVSTDDSFALLLWASAEGLEQSDYVW